MRKKRIYNLKKIKGALITNKKKIREFNAEYEKDVSKEFKKREIEQDKGRRKYHHDLYH